MDRPNGLRDWLDPNIGTQRGRETEKGRERVGERNEEEEGDDDVEGVGAGSHSMHVLALALARGGNGRIELVGFDTIVCKFD